MESESKALLRVAALSLVLVGCPTPTDTGEAATEEDRVDVCSYETSLDAPAVFLSTFEDGTVEAEVRADSSVPIIDARDGGAMRAVPNPHPDACNPSAYVLKATSAPGYTRAEYQSSRLPILDEAYIYTWREYIPADFFEGITLDWMPRSQWKTWPCGSDQTIDVADELCGGGGIFNDFSIDAHLGSFNFRTRPDCAKVQFPTLDHLDTWSTYVLEIRWTQSSKGVAPLVRRTPWARRSPSTAIHTEPRLSIPSASPRRTEGAAPHSVCEFHHPQSTIHNPTCPEASPRDRC